MKKHVLTEKTHIGKYLSRSHRPVYQLLFLLPLLVVYEVAAVIVNFNTPFELRNGADILLKYALYGLGIRSVFSFVLATLLFVSLMLVVAMKKYKKRIRWSYFAGLTLEASVYGIIIGVVSSKVLSVVSGSNPFLSAGHSDSVMQQLMIGVGAGVYEEIVFRALLITFIFFILDLFKVSTDKKTFIAVLFSSLLFSAFHYVGEFGEPFSSITFIYRVVAGILLSGLYVFRGIGVSAWSHALYDVYVVFGIL